MRGARSSIAGFALLVAAQAPAAETGAPLESTKQELRQLEATQKNRGTSATPDSVKVDTPALDARGPENSVIQQWTDRKKAEDQVDKRKARKSENWLLNGMEQLGREGTATTDAAAKDSGETDSQALVDTSDPEYLLKVFDEQKKHPDNKAAPTKSHQAHAPDPFAPFLQSWLGSSPVRDQVMEQFRKGNENTGGAPGTAPQVTKDYRSPEAAFTATSPASAPSSASGAPKPNPYLVDLAPSPAQQNEAIVGAVPVIGLDRALSASGSTPVTAPPVAPLPETRPPMKGPPPSPADEKKYFPQLNKF